MINKNNWYNKQMKLRKLTINETMFNQKYYLIPML